MASQSAPLSRLRPRPIGAVNWLGLFTLIEKEVERFMKIYAQTIIAPVIMTLLFFLVFSFSIGSPSGGAGKAAGVLFLVPGLVMMMMAQNAFVNTCSSLVLSKVQGNIVDVLMPPLSSLELTIAYALGGTLRGLLVGLTSVMCLVFFVPLPFHDLFSIAYFAVFGSMMLSLMGLIGGIWSEKFDHMATVQNFLIMPATFLSGTFYSVNQLPPEWRFVCHLNPFFYMIDGFRYGFLGRADGMLWIGMAVLFVMNLGLLGAAYAMFESGYKLKT